MRHLRGEHEAALASATEVVDRARSYRRSGLWAWELYTSLPYALELGRRGRHTEALDYVGEVLDDNHVPETPGVMTSVVTVLAALAVLRGDDDTASLLLAHAGHAIVSTGVRTPVDIALYAHYLRRWGGVDAETARRNRERASEMSVADAVARGLDGG